MDDVATIPIDSPGVGGEFVTIDGVPHHFVTGEKGLSIHDVSDPALPALVSTTPFPHSQHGDVSVAADGSRVVISADGGLPIPVRTNQGVHVFDTSDLTSPVKLASFPRSSHTTECADPRCEWLCTSTGLVIADSDPRLVLDPRPTSGTWAEGSPALAASGCSGTGSTCTASTSPRRGTSTACMSSRSAWTPVR